MKITREKLIGLSQVFENLSGEKANIFFHYNLKKNKQKIVEELKILEEIEARPSEEYASYEKRRVAFCEAGCERKEDGEPVILNPNTEFAKYSFTDEKLLEVNKQIDDLKEECKDVIADFEKNRKEFLQLLSEEVDIDFVLFSLKDMPQEVKGSDIDLLFDLIKEE